MISIIICSINPVLFTRIGAHYKQLLGAEPHEIIGIHDARGIGEGYNRGLARSRGDMVVFSHDDIEIWTPEFGPRLKEHLGRFDAIGVAGTQCLIGPGWNNSGPPYTAGQITHPIAGEFQVTYYGGYRQVMGGMQAMDGLFLAFRREAIERVGWDAKTFDGFHCYDVDCTYRAFRMGFRLAVALDLPMLHQSGGSYDALWRNYADLFIQKHGAHLETLPPRHLQQAVAQVKTKEEAQKLMRMYYERLPA